MILITCPVNPEWEQLAPVSGLFEGAEQLSISEARGRKARRGHSGGRGRY